MISTANEIASFRAWLSTLRYNSPYMKAIRQELASRNGKRQTPHAGPGRPKKPK